MPQRRISRPTRRAVLLGAVIALTALAAGCSSSAVPHKAGSTTTVPTSTSGGAPATAVTFPGPAGVRAAWVVAENARPGTTAWHISSTGPAPIAGYAGTTAATVGQTVALYVTTPAPRFHVEAFRMGYYHGRGARLVWRSAEVAGRQQPGCPLTPGINMISCHWRVSLEVPIGSAWVQGDYLLKLVADPGEQSYVPLTVWDPASHATYVVDNSVFTWQAWNNYGGYDMYGGGPPGQTPTYDSRSRVLSYDRPYAYGQGAGDFLGNELPLVRFVEEHGLDVTYWTDITFTEHPTLILNHRAYLSLGHAECWSNPQRAAAVLGIAHGVNFVFFAASPILRHVRLQAGPSGPAREMVDYRDPAADPIIHSMPTWATGDTWADPPASAPPSEITGDTYGGYGLDDPMVIVDAGAWPFAGTGLHNGSELPHLVQYDFDFYAPGQPGPTNVQILAHSPVQPLQAIAGANDSDMVYYTAPSGAGVIATGTNDWINALSPCPGAAPCRADAVRQITANILRVFGQGPAGRTHPSVANWQGIAH